MNISIRTKSILLVVALVVMVSGTVAFFFIRTEQKLINSQYLEKGLLLARGLSYNAEYAVLTGNRKMLENLVEGTMGQPDVIFCVIWDIKGKILAQGEAKGIKAELTPIDELTQTGERFNKPVIKLHHMAGQDHYDITVLITSAGIDVSVTEEGLFLGEEEGPEEDKPTTHRKKSDSSTVKRIGYAEIGISLESAKTLMRQTERTAAHIVVVLTVILIIISALIVTLVLRPVRQLVDATKRIAKGELDYRVQTRSRDEIGDLAQSFNKMAETLKKSTVSIGTLKDAEKRFEDISKNVGDWIWEIDPSGKYTYASSAAEKVIGYFPGELIGKYFYDFFPPTQREEIKAQALEVIKNKGKFENFTNYLMHKNGDTLKVETSGIPVLDEKGELAGYRGVDRDVTERERVKESQRLAQLGKLVSDMAHEVNNPLMVISGRAQISLMEDPKSEVIRDSLGIIMDQCYRAKSIIERLLLFSKPSKKELKETDMNKAISFAVQILEHQLELKDVKIEMALDPALPLALADEKQMHEIFVNLMRNSADAMPHGGNITIMTSLKGGNIWIDFKDTGSGISEEYLEKIFDPFFTTKDHGTGLGLSVCYGIMKAHGGEMKITSKLGESTTVTLILPVNKQ
jgi:PAS domain S-box-containing protein